MSINSGRVRSFRKRQKSRMVRAMGDCCQICGYDKSIEALTFHHIDPKQKKFALGTSNTMSWERVSEEIKKCVLLCFNCHIEYHAGLVTIPKNYKRFDPNIELEIKKYRSDANKRNKDR